MFKLKKILPRTLFGRSLMIIMTPVLLLQLIGTYIFYDRHWDRMADRLAFALVGEISLIITEIENGRPMDDIDAISQIVSEKLDIVIRYDVGKFVLKDDSLSGWRPSLVASRLKKQLEQKIKTPYSLHIADKERWIEIVFALEDGRLHVLVPERRLFSSSSYIFILWMVGLSIILFTIAMIFMRNQIRPIRKLAIAADWLGKGRDIQKFKPEGAKEVRQAAEAFIRMRDRIRRQINQRTEMLAGVSHDLRTPITRMKLALSMMNGDDAKEMSEDIAEMEEMINAYLDFARGEGEENAEMTDIKGLLEEVLSDCKRQDIPVNLIIKPKDPVSVWLRSSAFKRCLNNVIQNADRFADHIDITLDANEEAEQVTITVDDNGEGIPEEEYENVFRPFYRVEGSRNRKTGGVGLGLSIVQDVVSSHGGKVNLGKSTLNGLSVKITLPW